MRGGKRVGAGRPAGAATKRTREIADRAAAEGLTPLQHMLSILRDETAEPSRRDDMAKAAAPYLHPRLSSVDARVEGRVTWEQLIERSLMPVEPPTIEHEPPARPRGEKGGN